MSCFYYTGRQFHFQIYSIISYLDWNYQWYLSYSFHNQCNLDRSHEILPDLHSFLLLMTFASDCWLVCFVFGFSGIIKRYVVQTLTIHSFIYNLSINIFILRWMLSIMTSSYFFLKVWIWYFIGISGAYLVHRRHQVLHDGPYIRWVSKQMLTTNDLIIWEIDI